MDGVAPAPPFSARVRSLLAAGWWLLALALVVRVAQILATPDWTPSSDPEDYIRHAQSIAAGNGMAESLVPGGGPSALRPPAYPYFLGLVFALTGDSETAGRLASALLGVLTVALIAIAAEQLWSRRVALVAMAVAAVYPPLVLVSGTLLSEALALPLMLAVLVLLLEHRGGPRPGWVAPAVGALFGLSLLNRPALVVLALPVAVVLWGRPWRSSRALLAPAVALVVAALTIVPWTIRNISEFDAFVPISTQSGFLLSGTYNDVSDNDPELPGAHRPASLVPALLPIVTDRSLDENEMNKKLGEAGRDYAKEHKGYIAEVVWWNGLRVLQLSRPVSNGEATYAFQGIGPGYAKLATLGWGILALLALAGMALGALRAWPWWLWLLPPLLWLSVAWISGDIRYRLPIEPFVIWAGAYGLVALAERVRGTRRAQPR